MSTMFLYGRVLVVCSLLTLNAPASTLPPGDDSIPEPSAPQAAPNRLPAWVGTYRGTLPAADCPGIRTVLTLTDKGEYRLTSTYLTDEPQTFTDDGKINWIELGKRFEILTDGIGAQYEIEGDRIYRLSARNERVTGPLAASYVLTRDR